MAFDAEIASRIRQLLADESATERHMFGGLAFLLDGNMAVAANSHGGLMVRVDPDDADELVASTPARYMEMRGRPMRGWLRLDADAVRTTPALARWVTIGTKYARSLPPKG
jgi:TfoX/Sxy family transcriptional regulator of competence genes